MLLVAVVKEIVFKTLQYINYGIEVGQQVINYDLISSCCYGHPFVKYCSLGCLQQGFNLLFM